MSACEVKVRPAGDGDYQGLNAVFAEADELHRRSLPRIFRQDRAPDFDRGYFASLRENPDAALLLAEYNRQCAGFIILTLRNAPDTPVHVPRRYAVVDFLAVRHTYRRQGIGRALMAAGQQSAEEHGASAIELNVWEFNQEALTFYERLGYTTASRKMWLSLERAI